MHGDDGFDYGQLMQRAMRSVISDVLGRVAEDGLPGDHHFYICFETGHPGVDIPDWLHERYPEEMTIVLQDWFDDLAVTRDRFSVTLNFSDQAHKLVVPFAAVRTFVDPSVKFGLKFDAHDPDEIEIEDDPENRDDPGPDDVSDVQDDPATKDGNKAAEREDGAQVVSLDSFRKT